MREIFTNRAKKVIALAKYQAKENEQDLIYTQNILFGLLKESSLAHHILSTNGVTIPQLLEEIGKVHQFDSEYSETFTFTNINSPQPSNRTKKLYEDAVKEATALGHNYVGTEHLLLAMFVEPLSIGAHILILLGLDLDRLRKGTLELMGFYNKNYVLRLREDTFAVIVQDSTGEEVIGRYDSDSDEVVLNRPISITEIQRIIEAIRNDQKRIRETSAGPTDPIKKGQ